MSVLFIPIKLIFAIILFIPLLVTKYRWNLKSCLWDAFDFVMKP